MLTGKMTPREEAINKLIAVHGDKYDYSKTEYLGVKRRITITCPRHGKYTMLYSSHVRGRGCRKCHIEKVRMSANEYIESFRKIHDDRYEYRKPEEIINQHSIVTITCKIHGDFRQEVRVHKRGMGCTRCHIDTLLKSTGKFINDANIVHGWKYDYAKCEYSKSTCKVTITCPTHGDFSQEAASHLRGAGCPKCATIADTKRKTASFSVFQKEANEIHGEQYVYSESEYIDKTEKITITCKACGKNFRRSPLVHLRGHGCPKCKIPIGEKVIAEILNALGIKYTAQKSIKGCKSKRSLRFDFYLPRHTMCIEYNGKQHYTAIQVFGGEEALRETQRRDQIKRDFCKKQGITLLEIPYTMNKEEIVIELCNLLNRGQIPLFVNLDKSMI